MIFFPLQRLHVASFTPIFCSLISFACQLLLSVLPHVCLFYSPSVVFYSRSVLLLVWAANQQNFLETTLRKRSEGKRVIIWI